MCCRLMTCTFCTLVFIAVIYIFCQTWNKTQSSNEQTRSSVLGFLEDMKEVTCTFVIEINSYIKTIASLTGKFNSFLTLL